MTNIPTVSSATAARLADDVSQTLSGKAPLASPTFMGVPKVPTANISVNNTQIAITAFVKNVLAENCIMLQGIMEVAL